VRGLPEMAIKDIRIENAVIESKKGLVCQEAENIQLKNVSLFSTDTSPVLEVQNSRDITLDGIQYANNANLLLRVTGDRTKAVKVVNTNTKSAKKDLEVGPQVGKKTVTVAKK
jgi:DNA sulfur modification protein DndE